MKNIYILTIVILIISTQSIGQVLEINNLPEERGYEPIEISGNYFNLFDSLDVQTDQLFLYAYHNTTGWEPIPFQIDESNPYDPSNGILDSNDVLIFLAQDLGDKISLGNYIDNEDAKSNNRYEIEISDAIERSKKGWCYLYKSSTLTEADKSPIKYISYDSAEDKIIGKYYTIDHNDKWFPEDIRITADGGGTGEDFYDRTKLRVILVPVVYPLVFFEDSLVTQEIQYTKNPVVRLKRKITLDLVIGGYPWKQGIEFTMIYYPYSTKFSGQLKLEESWRVKTLRMSYDFDSTAIGMKFFSGDSNGVKNSNILIDGANKLDNVDTSLVKNTPNWTMATGTPGTILTINNIYYKIDSTITEPYYQYLYYWDDASVKGGTLTGQYDPDTGDSLSFGDHGMMFTSYSLVGVFTYKSTTFLLEANKAANLAQNIFYNFNSPMNKAIRLQSYMVDVNFTEQDNLPHNHRLFPNFPNPFNPITTITFELPQNENVSLKIFNIHGKHIITLVNENLTAGAHSYIWNSSDSRGNLVSSGVYFCIMQTTDFQSIQKMVLIK